MLLPEAAEAVDVYKIMKFCQSGLGRRVAASPEVRREIPFNLRCSCGRIFDELDDCDEELLIQGVIDLFFREDNELVVVDFKTDHVTPDNYKELVSQYRVQINLYQEALKTINQAKIKAGYLYFFATGEAILV